MLMQSFRQRPQGNNALNPDVQAQLASIQARRQALNDQLVSLTMRRDLLTQQIGNADAAGKAELQNQIREVASRTSRLNAELNKLDDAQIKLLQGSDVGRTIVTPEPQVRVQVPQISVPPFPMFPPQSNKILGIVEKGMVLNGVGFALILFAMWRWLRRPRGAAKLASDDVARIEQLQRAVDVMAVEMERISESQRYVAKMLNDRALGAGGAQEVPAPARDAQRAGADRK